MANPKIPKGYQGKYGTAADGSPVLIMVSRSDYATDENKSKKEHKPMANNNANEQMTIPDGQPQGQFTPYTTEEKREYAKQFTPEQRRSYRKGQQNAYAHMGNIGKRNSQYIHGNLQKDEAATPAPSAPAASKPNNSRKNNGQKK
ncbi:MAG: hypothetical protein NC131_00465 [Roseburia sp.]|nr:hypothetical protein [Roseburia sp.]